MLLIAVFGVYAATREAETESKGGKATQKATSSKGQKNADQGEDRKALKTKSKTQDSKSQGGAAKAKPPQDTKGQDNKSGQAKSTRDTKTQDSKAAGAKPPDAKARDSAAVAAKQELGKSWRNDLGMDFLLIPAGEFTMGSDRESNEKPAHKVRINKSFYLSVYEVTQAQWQAIMGNNPSSFKSDPKLPVETVSWEKVQEFIRKLNAKEKGKAYRLPTEAEWEYAARAGTKTLYSFGENPKQLGPYAWCGKGANNQTHPIGQRKPNAWGLYDMHGNVWEWVQDWFGVYPAEATTDPAGPPAGTHRVFRGGSWSTDVGHCRSAHRSAERVNRQHGDLGFRLARSAE
jgi:formylglycine-generating enzyme required for sulfatase activity